MEPHAALFKTARREFWAALNNRSRMVLSRYSLEYWKDRSADGEEVLVNLSWRVRAGFRFNFPASLGLTREV